MRRTTARFAGLLFLAIITRARPSPAQGIDACISASEKALGQRDAGKLKDARATLSVCASPTCPGPVRASCQQRLAEVTQAIPSVVFFVKDGSGQDVASVKLTIDGAAQGDRLDGAAITLDPGEHEFRFQAGGATPVVKRLVLHQGETNRREEVILGPPAPVPMPVTAPPPAPLPDAGTRPGDGRRTIGLVLGGVGVAGLLLGGVLGALTLSASSSYKKNCGSNIGAPAADDCNAAGVSGNSDATTKGNASTIAFIAGGAVAATGAVLFLTAPKGDSRARVSGVGVGPSGVWLSGEF